MRDLEQQILTGEEEKKLQYEYMDKVRQIVKAKEEEKGRRLTCCVKTFGCQMNARDSEKLVGILTGKCQQQGVWPTGISVNLQEKESGYDDRIVWMYDAGGRGCGKASEILPLCQPDLRNT